MVKYPLTWVGISLYYLSELLPPGLSERAARATLPARWRDKPLNTLIRVLHRPEQVCDEAFIRAAYSLPCLAVDHPDGFMHIEQAPARQCGSLGTSHEIRVIGAGAVPVLPAAIHCPLTAARIERGDNESSLGYRVVVYWAEPGEQWKGLAFDAEHLFSPTDPRLGPGLIPLPNHLVVAIPPAESRGGKRAAMLLDRARARGCYPKRMLSIPINDRTRAALGVRDAAITFPDETDPAIVAAFENLLKALGIAQAAGDDAAARAGTAEAELATQSAEMQTLAEDAAQGRKIARDQALAEAPQFGVKISTADAAKLETADAVREVIVRAKVGAESFDRVPASLRAGYVRGVYDGMRKATTRPAGITTMGAADSAPQLQPGTPSVGRGSATFFGQAAKDSAGQG